MLVVLRGEKAKVAAAKPLIGFGDPVFNRGGTKVGECIASNRGYGSFYRGGTADLDVTLLLIERMAGQICPRLQGGRPRRRRCSNKTPGKTAEMKATAAVLLR